MKTKFVCLFGFVLIVMLLITTWASLQESVFAGGAKLLEQPWGIATLFDTYFAFLTFYVWVFYKEKSWTARIVWLIAILALGNIAMATYVLWQIKSVPAGSDLATLLLRREARATR